MFPTTSMTTPTTTSATSRPDVLARLLVVLVARLRSLWNGDAGMSTVEYAIGTIAAAAFAAVLYAVVSGDTIVTALTSLIQRALTATF